MSLKQPQLKRCVTHNGCFHADEVIACAILQKVFDNSCFDKFGNPGVPGICFIRTRDQETIDKADIVVDVGRIYDPEKLRFDHHQEDCNETYEESNIPLSSAGMVWKHFGKQVVQKLNPEVEEEDVEAVANAIYFKFFQEIDAHDNGVDQYPDEVVDQQRFQKFLSLGNTISLLNGLDIYNDDEQHDLFYRAVGYASQTFDIHANASIEKFLLKKKEKVFMDLAYADRFTHHESGLIVIMMEKYCKNWLSLLNEVDEDRNVLFYGYPQNGTNWAIRTLPKGSTFEARQDFLEEKELRKNIDEDNLVFAHKAKFMVVCKDLETCVKCAVASLP